MDSCCQCGQTPQPSGGSAARSEFAVEGMSCGNCVRHVTQAIQGLAGVAAVEVSLESGRASVRWSAGGPNPQAVIDAVTGLGFKISLVSSAQEAPPATPGESWHRNLLIGLLCTIPLVIGDWILNLGSVTWFRWFSFLLASLVQLLAGMRFYRGAWLQLKARSANMDTLVALGSTTAYVLSVIILLSGGGGHLFFMEAAAIITLISVGHWLEARMSHQAASSLRKLLHLAPPQARVRKADGSEELIPVSQVRVNDLVVIRPGDRIAVDGLVVEGVSSVDESMLTGESVPVDKKAGDTAYAGTVNINGRMAIAVTAAGEGTALSNIIAAVQRAQNSRASIQRLGDRVSSVFVPVVVLVAMATALWWWIAPASAQQVSAWVAGVLHLSPHATVGLAAALIHAAAVLIVACPCAMGLATPVAIMAGTNAAAERGILIRDGVALEKAGKITSVMFDKTGTLTLGQPVVVHSTTYVGNDRPRLSEMRLAASMARHSNHPLSQAVAQLDPEDMPLLNWEEVRGSGLQCYVHLSSPVSRLAVARLGSLGWLRECGVDLDCTRDFVEEWSVKGVTLMGIAVDKHVLGIIALEDAIKPAAMEVVEELKARGYSVHLLTGDNEHTARTIARRVQIPEKNVFAEVRPEQKAEMVKQLQARGERVAFIGDGINDAPALEQADLGIAVSRASDVALEAADMILLRSDIQSVPESLGLARATLRKIKQNLFWAFFYNVLGIPLAALGLLSPVFCALAMGASDLIVIGNALLLRHWRLLTWRKWQRELVHRLDAKVLGPGNS